MKRIGDRVIERKAAVIISIALAILLAGTLLNLLKNEPPPSTEPMYLDDRYDAGLDNWSYWGDSGYALQWDSNAAKISGDGYRAEGGMQKVVDLSTWNESRALLLSFDWRATSSYSSSSPTNANLLIQDADSGLSLYSQQYLVAGGTLDTGWRSYVNDISPYVQGHVRIRIVLYLFDLWDADWDQTNFYDNIKLTSTTSP